MNKLEDYVKGPLAVVCHDAGAANLIISWLKNFKNEIKVCMEGPAKNIWEKKFPDHKLLSLTNVMDNSKTLLSGTGGGSFEYEARIQAKKRNIKNISVIDHWVNYKERFICNDRELLPDLIIVSDKYAYNKAKITFPSILVVQLPNIYFQSEGKLAFSRRIRECQTPIENILIISEPLKEKIPSSDSTLDFFSIEFLMTNLNKLNLSKSLVNVTLRLHPAESLDKYHVLLERYKGLVTEFNISKNFELYKDIAWADLVVGVSSAALVISLYAKVPVMSILPPRINHFQFPHKEIMYLRDI